MKLTSTSLGSPSSYVLPIVGLGLVGYGAYAHFSVASVSHCDGCAPWHPLFVLTPLVVGTVLLVVAVALAAR